MSGDHKAGKTCQWLYDDDIAKVKAQGVYGESFADALHRALEK